MKEQLKYLRSPYTAGLSSFFAKMTDFIFDKHAHEEYSIGVTCSGRQDFFSGGAYHRSNVGNIISFNSEQVHDGCAGAGALLEYQMLYTPEHVILNMVSSIGYVSKEQASLKSSIQLI